MSERHDGESRYGAARLKSEHDQAIRLWAELAVIEQGSLGILRHFKARLEQRSVAELFDRAVTTSRAHNTPTEPQRVRHGAMPR